MTEFQQELDARSEHCPSPVMMTKNALKEMASGEILHVLATDPASVQDIKMLIDAIRYQLIDSSESDGEYHFYIRKS